MSTLVETEIGTIASEWKVAPLESICEPPQYGYTASAQEEGNVRFLRITDITDSGVNWPTVPFCECPPELVGKYRLACGDIVFARIGATTGKSYLIKNPPPSVFASYLIRVRTRSEIDSGFLSYFFRSDAYWCQVNAQKNANLKKGVSGSLLKTLTVPVPPLQEQRKIAAVLGLVQRAIEQQERLIVLTTELKKALLHKLFTEGLRGEPQKQTEIGPVPESWNLGTLNDVKDSQKGAIVSGPFGSNIGKRFFVESGVPLIRGCNLRKGDELFIEDGFVFITKEKAQELKSCEALPNDLIFTAAGTLGQVGLIPSDGRYPKYVISNKQLRARIDKTKAHPLFLFYWFSSSIIQKLIEQRRSGTSIPVINLSILRSLPVPVPTTVEEQEEIVNAITGADRKVKSHKKRKEVLNSLFRTLLHQLMTAQIRVDNLDLDEILHNL